MHFVIRGTPKYKKKCIFVSSPSTVFLAGLCSFRANSQTIVALFYYYFTYGPRAQTVCIVPSAGALSNYIEKASTDISDFLRSFSFLTVCSCFAVFVFRKLHDAPAAADTRGKTKFYHSHTQSWLYLSQHHWSYVRTKGKSAGTRTAAWVINHGSRFFLNLSWSIFLRILLLYSFHFFSGSSSVLIQFRTDDVGDRFEQQLTGSHLEPQHFTLEK